MSRITEALRGHNNNKFFTSKKQKSHDTKENLTTQKKFSRHKRKSHNTKEILTTQKKFSRHKRKSHDTKENLTTQKKFTSKNNQTYSALFRSAFLGLIRNEKIHCEERALPLRGTFAYLIFRWRIGGRPH